MKEAKLKEGKADQEEYDFSNAQITKIIDYGVNHSFSEGDTYNEKINEVCLVEDQNGFYHLMQGVKWGKEYQLYNSYRFKSRVQRDYRYTFEVIDAALINNHKLMFLSKVKKFKKDSYTDENINGIPTVEQCANLKATVEFLRIQIWEIDNTSDPKPLTIDIPQGYSEQEVMMFWKENIVIDFNNNCFYLQVFNTADETKVAKL